MDGARTDLSFSLDHLDPRCMPVQYALSGERMLPLLPLLFHFISPIYLFLYFARMHALHILLFKTPGSPCVRLKGDNAIAEMHSRQQAVKVLRDDSLVNCKP